MTPETSQANGQNDALLVETRGLTKRYGNGITAVDDLDLTIERGEVYGFLGPNGAGKTTTLRMLLGLIKPSSGTATVLGEEPGAPTGLARVGALVESPAFYPYLSGRADDKFKKYSLGMKQRLGVATALLKDPELLVLDEPANGLDPKGMADMRGIIRKVRGEGKTVLLSSHLLGEVEQICDRIGVILKGKVVAERTMEELRGREGGLLVRAEPLEEAERVVKNLPRIEEARVVDEMLQLTVDPTRAAEINAGLVNAGVRVSELRAVERSLEEMFLELTGGETV